MVQTSELGKTFLYSLFFLFVVMLNVFQNHITNQKLMNKKTNSLNFEFNFLRNLDVDLNVRWNLY